MTLIADRFGHGSQRSYMLGQSHRGAGAAAVSAQARGKIRRRSLHQAPSRGQLSMSLTRNLTPSPPRTLCIVAHAFSGVVHEK
jgi:hypothetical protein